jgi:hypothetical protein
LFLGEVAVQGGVADPGAPGAISIRLTLRPCSANAWAAAARIRSRFSRASLRSLRAASADAVAKPSTVTVSNRVSGCRQLSIR